MNIIKINLTCSIFFKDLAPRKLYFHWAQLFQRMKCNMAWIYFILYISYQGIWFFLSKKLTLIQAWG